MAVCGMVDRDRLEYQRDGRTAIAVSLTVSNALILADRLRRAVAAEFEAYEDGPDTDRELRIMAERAAKRGAV